MLLLKFSAYFIMAVIFSAMFFEIGYVLYHGMVNPPTYYEGRDWFDEEARRDCLSTFENCDTQYIEILDRDEEYFKEENR